MAWYNEKGKNSSIIISSRIRLARNLASISFPHRMNEQDFVCVIKKCREAYEQNEWLKNNFTWLEMQNMPTIEQQKLVEKHLISMDMINNPKGRAVILSKDEKVSIMINEEDHIRIQAICAGLNFEEAFKLAEKADGILTKSLEIAYSPKFGYLTSCPTNLGTGLRVSAMLHLPMLMESGLIEQLLAAVSRMGITVRGLYGEGSKANGNLFQISNQVTLGLSEEEILNRLIQIIENIVEKEQDLRKNAFQKQKEQITDRIWRSYGIMQYARMLSTNELLSLISDIRMGADMGILKILTEDLTKLLIEASPAHVAELCINELNSQERDLKRAEIVRKIKI